MHKRFLRLRCVVISCPGKKSSIGLFAMVTNTYCHVNLTDVALTATENSPLLWWPTLIITVIQFNRCCFDSNQVPSLQILPWQQTLIITYFHVSLIALTLTTTTKVPPLRLLPWWLSLTTTFCHVCSMIFFFEASIPKGIPSGCEHSRTCTLISLNLGKGAGLWGT